MSGSRAKNWCFTINNPTGLLDFESFPPIKYAVYQEEVGKKGNYHFQGYVTFSHCAYIILIDRMG